MDWLRQPKYKLWCSGFCLSMLAAGAQAAQTYPGVTAPYTLPNGQTLTIQSGNMQTTNGTNYTVLQGVGSTITVNLGATLSYAGTDSSGNAVRQTRDNATNSASTETLNNYGTIYTNGPISVYYSNSAGSPTNSVVINNYGSIYQAIYTSAPLNVTLNMLGSNANAFGNIDLNFATGGSSTVNIGSADGITMLPTDFTTKGILQNIQNINIYSGSNLNINTQTISITNIDVKSGGTATINYPLAGSGGLINVDGTLTLANSITNTGNFSSAGTTIGAENITVNTATFAVTGTYQSQISDVLNYGVLNLGTASVNEIDNFALTYTGGYFPAGNYLLATGQGAITTTAIADPTSYNTMFLTFGQPYVGGTGNKSIYTNITRQGFNQFVSSTLAQAIGSDLEGIGANNPTNDMVQILNAVEASTTSSQLQTVLLQLGPLISAPIFSIQIQSQALEEVKLRLAELRGYNTYDSYYAGDTSRDNHIWLRPYGDYANQDSKNDCAGYYATTGGFALGFDRDLDENYTLGLAGNYSLSHVRDKISSQSETNIKSYGGTLYGTYNFNETRYLDWLLGVIVNSYDAKRIININGLFLTANSSYSSQSFAAKGIWGKDYAAFDFLQVTPEASLQYIYNKQYAYSETGAPGANLNIVLNNTNSVQLGIGGKVAAPVLLKPGIFVPELHSMFYYNVINPQQNTMFGFVEAGTQQIISNFVPGRTQLMIGAAVTIGVVESLELKFNYDVLYQDRYTNHAFYLNFRYLL